jgi:hypothetical protein
MPTSAPARLALALLLCAPALTGAAGPNLHPNPTLTGTTQWHLTGAAPSNTSRGSGGSLAFTVGDRATGPLIRITPGKVYTCGGYLLGFHSPTDYLRLSVSLYGSAGNWLRNSPGASDWAYATPGQWQEMAVIHQARTDEAWLTLLVSRPTALDGATPVYLDDVYCREGITLEHAPTTKQPFTGGITRVSATGQVTIRQATGTYKPEFLKCMYALGSEPDWRYYAANGWNCNAWASSLAQVEKGVKAGLPYAFFQLAQYIQRGAWAYGRLDWLQRDLGAILASPYAGNLVGYYFDNEAPLDIALAKQVIDTVKALDTKAGVRQRPVYILQGNPGRAPAYAALADITGSYVQSGLQAWLWLLELAPGQRKPVVVGTLQESSGKSASRMRQEVFGAIHPAQGGATALGYWHTHPISQDPWYTAFPSIAADAAKCVLQGICP